MVDQSSRMPRAVRRSCMAGDKPPRAQSASQEEVVGRRAELIAGRPVSRQSWQAGVARLGLGGGSDPLDRAWPTPFRLPRLGSPAGLAENLVKSVLDKTLLVNPLKPLVVILADRLGQVIGQLGLNTPPWNPLVAADTVLEFGVLSQFSYGSVLKGFRGIHCLSYRHRLSARRRHGLVQGTCQLAPQARRIAVDRWPIVFRICLAEAGLEQQGTKGDGVGCRAGAGPEDPVPGQWLIKEGRQQVIGEVGVRLLQRTQVTLGKQMEDEPVVTLRKDLCGDAAGLLGDKNCAEIVLAALLHPSYERSLALTSRRSQHRLRLLDDRDCRDAVSILLGEF